MSAQTMWEAWQPIEAHYREQVYAATWGHLAPRRNKHYRGEILFAHGAWGDLVPLHCGLADLNDSPWFFDALNDFIEANAPEPGVYRFTGYFCNYRFVGTVEALGWCPVVRPA